MDAEAAGQGTDKVRFSKSLSKGEKVSTAFRKEKIKEALDALGIPYDWDTVPNIAVMGSGGGLRATIALCGTLVELKNQNILDCIMYLAGVSGSAWCMSSICKTENWTERLKELEKHQRETLTESQWNFETAANALMKATNDENYSLTDFWSYFIVYQMLNELDESTLPEQRRSSENGKNPYPIYAALNNMSYKGNLPGTWFEFTPHEVGIPDLGAYIDTKYFGSVFENGQMIEEKEEKNISYLQGIWGSAFGSKKDLKKQLYGVFHLYHRLRSVVMKTSACISQWKWGTTNNFLYKCCGEEVYNLSSERTLSLIDPGMDINTAYPLILRPERNVKLILSFDFSSGNPFETVEKAADHCAKCGIKFPKIDGIKPEDKKNPSGCYIFRGRDAPTVMHFPLFNKDNCLDKTEVYRIQFGTLKMKYTNGEIEKLLTAAKKNVVNAQQKIWEEIGRAAAASP
ncbi:cytosolic phospholipase A2 gamma [Sphaerodactylus townsendi]|uniref:cytosolic phospholipase A2 gamma n=1 Tax=Sphaerodactylus townsendi TaxID=933632 RepID=UPI002026F102|nr:cytosolic phospholipase A2 gamma [Sphaerodactylus townsendi]